MAKSELNEYYKAIKGLNRAKFIDEVIRWASEARPADIHKWKAIVKVYLRDMGWNRRAIEDFFDIGTSETFRSISEGGRSAKQFYDDVFYCSDRMGIERLCRCQVKYRIALSGIENGEQRP